MQYVLAVDGGNTKTIALVATLDGTIVGAGLGGCGDIYNADPVDGATDSAAAAVATVERTAALALQAAGATPSEIVVTVLNMAGADWPEDIAFWQDTMTERGLGRRVLAQNDALGVLYIGSPEAVGVSVVCGTGVATGARAADGRIWHSSFWQDEAQGSSHLGQKMLFAIYRAALGIEPPTSLTGRVLGYLNVASVEDVLHLFHNRNAPAPIAVDRLTPLLLDEADAGDALALRVVQDHGTLLGNIASAAARRVGLEGTTFPLVLAGGVFRHPTTTLADAIVAPVRAASPDLWVVRSASEPIIGVLLQALALAGTAIDGTLVGRLLPTVPTDIFVSTVPA